MASCSPTSGQVSISLSIHMTEEELRCCCTSLRSRVDRRFGCQKLPTKPTSAALFLAVCFWTRGLSPHLEDSDTPVHAGLGAGSVVFRHKKGASSATSVRTGKRRRMSKLRSMARDLIRARSLLFLTGLSNRCSRSHACCAVLTWPRWVLSPSHTLSPKKGDRERQEMKYP